MSGKNEAIAAISELNGQELHGRALKVSEAKPRSQSGNRSGGNGYRSTY
jgi:RNA recognition motif-containing protein